MFNIEPCHRVKGNSQSYAAHAEIQCQYLYQRAEEENRSCVGSLLWVLVSTKVHKERLITQSYKTKLFLIDFLIFPANANRKTFKTSVQPGWYYFGRKMVREHLYSDIY